MLPSEVYTNLGLPNATKTVYNKLFTTDKMRSLAKEEVLELLHVFITLYKVIDCRNAFETERNQVLYLITTCQRQIKSCERQSYSQDQAPPPLRH